MTAFPRARLARFVGYDEEALDSLQEAFYALPDDEQAERAEIALTHSDDDIRAVWEGLPADGDADDEAGDDAEPRPAASRRRRAASQGNADSPSGDNAPQE